MSDARPGVLLLVRFKSTLSFEEVKAQYEQRMPEFRAQPGLLQKYYGYDKKTDEWTGTYLWDSRQSLDVFLASDLRKSIPAAYKIDGAPRVEIVDVTGVLRA